MIAVLIVAGAAYVFIADRNSNGTVATTYNVPVEKSPLPKAVPPAANAPEGVAIETLVSPVAAGHNSSVGIRTNAGSSCTIVVTYNNVQSKDSGLAPKTADLYGNVSWTWTVDSSAPVGSWPVKITCVYHGRTGVVIGNLQVTR